MLVRPPGTTFRNTLGSIRRVGSQWGADCHNQFELQIPSVTPGTRPAGAFGVAVTPDENAYGAWAEIAASSVLTEDCYEVLINFNSNNLTATIKETIATIGWDPAGGTAYGATVNTNINHLLCSNASSYIAGAGGIWYRFPLFIPRGSSIACKASMNNASAGTYTLRCHMIFFCKPTRKDRIRVGKFVRTFGADTANSRGTIIVPGGAAEGTWTQIGAGAVGERLWYWDFGIGLNDADNAAFGLHTDIAFGSAGLKTTAITNAIATAGAAETLNLLDFSRHFEPAVTDLMYARQQNSGAETDHSIILYGVGG